MVCSIYSQAFRSSLLFKQPVFDQLCVHCLPWGGDNSQDGASTKQLHPTLKMYLAVHRKHRERKPTSALRKQPHGLVICSLRYSRLRLTWTARFSEPLRRLCRWVRSPARSRSRPPRHGGRRRGHPFWARDPAGFSPWRVWPHQSKQNGKKRGTERDVC